jgi:uroporphyrinogen decarboxylase
MLVEAPLLGIGDIPEPGSDAAVDESQFEAVSHVTRELGSTHFIVGRCGDGSFPWHTTVGMEEFLLRMRTDPGFVHRAVAWQTARVIAIAHAMLDLGCDAVLLDDDYCGSAGPMMSPADLRRFCMPALAAQCEAVRKRGRYAIKHCDGFTLPILEDMIQAGIQAWQGIQPRLGMNMALLKERFGERICLWGGVNCETLTSGTPGEVRAEALYALQVASQNGGLILGSSNTVMVGIPWENYRAMLDVLH